LNSGGQCLIRLMRPRRVRYEDAYARAYPFTGLVNGMLDPKMVEETAELMRTAVERGVEIDVISNNREGQTLPSLRAKWPCGSLVRKVSSPGNSHPIQT
jgi:hypothetical protein